MSCGICQKTVYYEECSQCQCDVCEPCESKFRTCERCGVKRLCPDCISRFNHDCDPPEEAMDVDEEEE